MFMRLLIILVLMVAGCWEALPGFDTDDTELDSDTQYDSGIDDMDSDTDADSETETDGGCSVNSDCEVGTYCNLGFGECNSRSGVCEEMYEGCLDFWEPVCGCDGVTYGNACEATYPGVTIDFEGECLE